MLDTIDTVPFAPESPPVDHFLQPPFCWGSPAAIAFLSARSIHRLETLLREDPQHPLIDAWWQRVNDEWAHMITTHGPDSHEAMVAKVNVELTFRTVRGVVSKDVLRERVAHIVIKQGG